jgi:pimeloyl-ACP methyl ester carboxylesterase
LTTSKRRGKRVRRPLLLLVTVPLGAAALLMTLLACWLAYAGARLAWTETADRKQAAPAGGRWLRAEDTDIHVHEWGAPDAPVLLLVHGTGAWTGTWAGNVQAMQAAGYRVVALDLPPFGFSEPPASGDYSRQAQARRILAVARQLGPQPVTLLGHSFGGGPAAEAAMLEPARIQHLVLVDAAIGLHEEPVPRCESGGAAATLLAWPGLRTLLVGAVGTEPAFSSFWLEQFVARKEVVTTARTAIYQQPFVTRRFSGGLGDWAYQFATSCEPAASTRPAGFRQLQVPVSLVWGRLDTITPLAQGERLQQLLPRARLTVLQGVGHIPQIEDAAGFNFAIANVLRERP